MKDADNALATEMIVGKWYFSHQGNVYGPYDTAGQAKLAQWALDWPRHGAAGATNYTCDRGARNDY